MSQGDIDAKNELLGSLRQLLLEVSKKEERARISGDSASADKFRAQHDALRKEIDVLEGQALDAWTGDLEPLTEQLRAASARVQDGIRSIQRKMATAEQVVKAVDEVERAIATVRTIRHGLKAQPETPADPEQSA